MNERDRELFITEEQLRKMAEKAFGATVWPTNRGTDGKKSARKNPPKPAPVSESDAGRQPGNGLDEVRIRVVNGVEYTVRDADNVFRAADSLRGLRPTHPRRR